MLLSENVQLAVIAGVPTLAATLTGFYLQYKAQQREDKANRRRDARDEKLAAIQAKLHETPDVQ